jgi:hypothetical protein
MTFRNGGSSPDSRRPRDASRELDDLALPRPEAGNRGRHPHRRSARQYSGTTGKIKIWQLAVHLSYATSAGYACCRSAHRSHTVTGVGGGTRFARSGRVSRPMQGVRWAALRDVRATVQIRRGDSTRANCKRIGLCFVHVE